MDFETFLEKENMKINYSDVQESLTELVPKHVKDNVCNISALVEDFELYWGYRFKDGDETYYRTAQQAICRPFFHFIMKYVVENYPQLEMPFKLKLLAEQPEDYLIYNVRGEKPINVAPVREDDQQGNYYILEYDQYHTAKKHPIAMKLFLKHSDEETFDEILTLIEKKMRGRLNVYRDDKAYDGFHLHISVGERYYSFNSVPLIKDVVSTVWKLINL